MPIWVDPEGNRYWLDGDPKPGVHRDDLVPDTPPDTPPEDPPA